MNKPYIGITGITSIKDAKFVASCFEKHGFVLEGKHVGMIGFLVSYKNLLDKELRRKNKRYARFIDLPALLEAGNGRVLNTIHYNTHIGKEEIENKIGLLSEQIKTILSYEDIYDENLCRTIQLNIKWPPPNELEKVKDAYPNTEFMLQLHDKEKEIEDIVEKVVKEYEIIDSFLIDSSGGTGLLIDIDYAVDLYCQLKKHVKKQIRIAGGLNDKNVYSIVRNLEEKLFTNQFSIDAESGIRNKETDLLDRKKVERYIKNSAKGFRIIRK